MELWQKVPLDVWKCCIVIYLSDVDIVALSSTNRFWRKWTAENCSLYQTCFHCSKKIIRTTSYRFRPFWTVYCSKKCCFDPKYRKSDTSISLEKKCCFLWSSLKVTNSNFHYVQGKFNSDASSLLKFETIQLFELFF